MGLPWYQAEQFGAPDRTTGAIYSFRSADLRERDRAHRLGRRGLLGVAAGAAATALVGAAAPTAAAAPAAAGRGRRLLPPGRLGIQLSTLRDKVSPLGFAKVFAERERVSDSPGPA